MRGWSGAGFSFLSAAAAGMHVAVSTSLHALEATNAEEMEENAEDASEIGLLASVRMRFRQGRAMNFLRLALGGGRLQPGSVLNLHPGVLKA